MTKIKKAILTGGGRATRLRPITTTINKHLIPLANKPMIFHAIEKVVEAGVEEIFINTNPGEKQLQDVIGDGAHWGVRIKYFEQTGGPQGIAHVVKCAQKFIGNDPFIFYLSDNIIIGGIDHLYRNFSENNLDCLLSFATVPDPERFGSPIFDAAGKLVDVIEKPLKPANQFAQTGIYFYGPKVFFKAFDHIKKSDRGEYEISDIHSYLLKNKYNVSWEEITGWWKDTGKPDDLIMANKLLMDEIPAQNFKREGMIEGGAIFEGNVSVGVGATVAPDVKIIGPVIIGPNASLKNCSIGPHVTIGPGSIIEKATIINSIIFSNNTIQTDKTIYDSIIGDSARIIDGEKSNHERLILGDHTVIE